MIMIIVILITYYTHDITNKNSQYFRIFSFFYRGKKDQKVKFLLTTPTIAYLTYDLLRS